MFQNLSTDDVALVLTVVGAVFLLRFLLAVRRLRTASGRAGAGSLFEDAGRVSTPAAFGADLEPERRHALRQFVFGAALSAAGLLLSVWLLFQGRLLAP